MERFIADDLAARNVSKRYSPLFFFHFILWNLGTTRIWFELINVN